MPDAASLGPSPSESRPRAPKTEAGGPDGLRGSGRREGVLGRGPYLQPTMRGGKRAPRAASRPRVSTLARLYSAELGCAGEISLQKINGP